MIHAPGLAPGVSRSYTEHVDVWPTISMLATGAELPRCPAGVALLETPLCTMGYSLVPLMRDPTATVAAAAFSQYPRGYCERIEANNSNPNCRPYNSSAPPPPPTDIVGETWQASPSPCFDKCTMGYTLVAALGGREWRYTEWVDFGTLAPLTPNWNRLVGVELYDHGQKSESGLQFEENFNLAAQLAHAATRAALHKMLVRGPLSGGGWGPWSTPTHDEALE